MSACLTGSTGTVNRRKSQFKQNLVNLLSARVGLRSLASIYVPLSSLVSEHLSHRCDMMILCYANSSSESLYNSLLGNIFLLGEWSFPRCFNKLARLKYPFPLCLGHPSTVHGNGVYLWLRWCFMSSDSASLGNLLTRYNIVGTFAHSGRGHGALKS